MFVEFYVNVALMNLVSKHGVSESTRINFLTGNQWPRGKRLLVTGPPSFAFYSARANGRERLIVGLDVRN